MPDDPWPIDFAERCMDGNEPDAVNDAGQQDGHCLAVLATDGVDRHEGSGPDHVPAVRRDTDVGEVGGHGWVSQLAVRGSHSGPRRRPEDVGRHLRGACYSEPEDLLVG